MAPVTGIQRRVVPVWVQWFMFWIQLVRRRRKFEKNQAGGRLVRSRSLLQLLEPFGPLIEMFPRARIRTGPRDAVMVIQSNRNSGKGKAKFVNHKTNQKNPRDQRPLPQARQEGGSHARLIRNVVAVSKSPDAPRMRRPFRTRSSLRGYPGLRPGLYESSASGRMSRPLRDEKAGSLERNADSRNRPLCHGRDLGKGSEKTGGNRKIQRPTPLWARGLRIEVVGKERTTIQCNSDDATYIVFSRLFQQYPAVDKKRVALI
jgi:hypothetical protein